jgi:hypothetical protein
MAEQPPKRLVERDVVQVEFLIDDLVKQLVTDRLSPVAACNGCKGCKAAVDLSTQEHGRE